VLACASRALPGPVKSRAPQSLYFQYFAVYPRARVVRVTRGNLYGL
jgi:hypothetical protein